MRPEEAAAGRPPRAMTSRTGHPSRTGHAARTGQGSRTGQVSPMGYAVRVLAPNPGPFTLEGTNTWVVGTGPTLVIDPGPPDPGHVDEVAREAGQVAAILLTHQHPDHAPAAPLLAERTGAPVLAFSPRPGQRRLRPGEVVRAGGVRLRAVHAPGHTPDHLAFHDPDFGALFTGDTVLGRGTSVVDPPEGDMADYLRSLSRLAALGPRVLYPGHGPAVWDAGARLREYLEHRRSRERQVLAALEAGPRSPEEMVPEIYADHPVELHPAAARSVLAHLLKLERDGLVVRVGDGERFARRQPAPCRRCGRPAPPGSGICPRCAVDALQEAPPPPGGGPEPGELGEITT